LHRLQLAKSAQSTKEIIAHGLFISHLEAFNMTNLFDHSVKALNLPMTIMDLFEPLTVMATRARSRPGKE